MSDLDRPGGTSRGYDDLLADVEEAVQRALASGHDHDLRVLGHGEISLVIGWPADRPTLACKRLPLFPSQESADRYADLFARYLQQLERGGVQLLPSTFRTLAAQPDGRCAGYVVQPVLPEETLGPEVLRRTDPDPDHPLLASVVSSVQAVVDARTGLDAQISNWALADGAVSYFDVTTPILVDDDGRLALDVTVLTATVPWVIRGAVERFVAPPIATAYCDPRTVLLDLVANLHKERLDAWVPAFLEAVNPAVSPPITAEEARKYYRSNARLWEVMLRLRRADRWWQRHVRRRTYPFLLPRSTLR